MTTQPHSVKASAPPTLPEAASFLLDVIRFAAAILVVLSHLGHPEFATGLPNRQVLGDIAVPIFFVLSGFVIRFVTVAREHTLRNFLIDRAARMYSVILPAAALTLAVSVLCRHLAPAYFLHFFAASCTHPISRLLLNLTFLSQSWSHSTVFFLDSPFWSLSYECLFYLAYAIFFYLRGTRRIIALILWVAIAGPQVLFLFPLWILGCCLYDLYLRLRLTRTAGHLRRATLIYFILALSLFALGSRTLVAAPIHAALAFSTLPNPLLLLHLQPYRATMFALAAGTLAALLMLLLLLLSDLIPLQRKSLWPRRFRHLADATFAIYLMHYPLMVLATVTGLFRANQTARNVAVVTSICLLLILVARPLDLLKVALRSHLRRLFPELPVPRRSQSQVRADQREDDAKRSKVRE